MYKNKKIITFMLLIIFMSLLIPSRAFSAELYNTNEITNSDSMKPVSNSEITSASFIENNIENNISYVKNQILFRSKKGISYNEISTLIKNYSGSILGYINSLGQYQVEFKNSSFNDLQEKINNLKNETSLKPDTISLNLIVNSNNNELNITPNDPWTKDGTAYTPVWNEQNPDGLEWGIEAVKALSAWKYSSKMKNVKVGIIEVGTFEKHNDIKFKSFYNNSITNSTGFHANHVAGIIGATSNNNIGITGVSPNSTLYAYGNSASTSSLIDSLNRAIVKDKVKIINYSAGFINDYLQNNSKEYLKEYFNNQIGDLLKTLLEGDNNNKKHDFLIVTSAGNSRNDKNPIVSAEINNKFTLIGGQDYDKYNDVKDRILVVGSVANNNNDNYTMDPYSQLGKRVDVVAPGNNIYSTLGNNSYGFMSGTSMASPHAAAVASMLWGLAPKLTGKDLKEYIITGADRNVSITDSRLSKDDNKTSYPVVNAINSINLLIEDEKF